MTTLIAQSLSLLPDQRLQGWTESRRIVFPPSYRRVKNVIFAGTGGSSMGAEMVTAWGRDRLRVPSLIISSGHLPVWADANTLVIVVSYSGSTAEAIAIAKEAKARGCKLFIVAQGGELARMARRHKLPAYIFDDAKTNPSRQPRMGVGITFTALLGALSKLGLLTMTAKEALSSIAHSHRSPTVYSQGTVPSVDKLASSLKGRLPLLVAAEHLTGNLVAFRNQIHENAKQFAVLDTLPELNHHLLEGLAHPKAARNLAVVFLRSKRYAPKTKKRFDITYDIVRRQGLKAINIDVSGPSALAEVFALLQLGSAVSLALADQNGVDPAKIPWVDYLKKRMASSR